MPDAESDIKTEILPGKWSMYKQLRKKWNVEDKSDFAHLIPGDPRTYHYSDEISYLEMYASSLYCITKKKGGWDALRHYEILLAGCVPYFLEVHNTPSRSLVFFPRDLIRSLMQLPGVPGEDDVAERLRRDSAIVINHSAFPRSEYESLRAAMLSYVEDHMLSAARARDLHLPHPRVFLHSQATMEKPVDYLRDLLLIGMLEIGLEVVATFDASYIFQDFNVSKLGSPWGVSYGRGFLYEQALHPSYKRFLTFWAPGDQPPREPFAYVKTTYNNKPHPKKSFFNRVIDVFVDGNDIWGAHPEPPNSARWYRREISDCHDLIKPARSLVGVLNSGIQSHRAMWLCIFTRFSKRVCPCRCHVAL